MKSRCNTARKFLIFWTLFIGIGAVSGSTMMLADTSGRLMGMDAMLPYFQKLPFAEYVFRDFLFSGIALLIVNGITNLTAAVLLFMKKKSGILLGGIFGVTLMLWICIQFNMSAPMRSFCKQASGKIKEADYILDHHNKTDYKSAADEMDSLLGIKRTGLKSFCCREGKFKPTSHK